MWKFSHGSPKVTIAGRFGALWFLLYLMDDEIGLHEIHARSERWRVEKSTGSYAIDLESSHGPTRTRSRRPPGSSRSGRTACRAWRAFRSSVRTASWAAAERSDRRCRGWRRRSAASRSRPTAAARTARTCGPGCPSCSGSGTRPDPEADLPARPQRAPPSRLGHIRATPGWAATRRPHQPAITRPRDASRRSAAHHDTAMNEKQNDARYAIGSSLTESQGAKEKVRVSRRSQI